MLYFSRSSPSFPTASIVSGLRTASRGVSITLQSCYPDMLFNSFLNFLKIATQIDNLSGSRSFTGSFIAVSLTALQHNTKYWWYKCYPNYYGSKQLTAFPFPTTGPALFIPDSALSGLPFPGAVPTLTQASSAVLPSAGQKAGMPKAATPNKGWAAPGKPEHICSAAENRFKRFPGECHYTPCACPLLGQRIFSALTFFYAEKTGKFGKMYTPHRN